MNKNEKYQKLWDAANTAFDKIIFRDKNIQ